MKFSFKQLDKNISTKVKTIVLVMGIFGVLSVLFIYMQYSSSKAFIDQKQALYEKNIEAVFIESVHQTSKFYKNRALANLYSYGISDALKQKDTDLLIKLSKKRWEVLKEENKYISSMSFYDIDKNLITHLGNFADTKLKNTKNYFNSTKKVYKVVVKDEENGYLVFSLDIVYFLSEIKKLLNINSFMQINDSGEKVFLDKNTLKFLNMQNFDHFKIENKYYATHKIALDNDFTIIFFQDITYDKQSIKDRAKESIILALLLGTLSFLILNYGFKILIDNLEKSNISLKQSEEKLVNLNKNLENKVKEEVAIKLSNENKITQQQRILQHQSKLASMGEMIGSIAHQWRQPLTALGGILVLIELLSAKDKLSHDVLKQKIKEANFQINFMSKTIDDFRNFFKPNKQKELFNITKQVNSAYELIKSSLKNNNIQVVFDIDEDTYIKGYPNEFSQVILNILINAKDALLERKIKDPYIKVNITQDSEHVFIDICDNAQGVSLEPIEKIFEPYVSTKHKSNGIGIGLYMSKNIIEKNMQGTLSVVNGEFGANFTIMLLKSL